MTADLRTLNSKELADRADALEEEAALVRALLREKRKQERNREELSRAVAAADADQARRRGATPEPAHAS